MTLSENDRPVTFGKIVARNGSRRLPLQVNAIYLPNDEPVDLDNRSCDRSISPGRRAREIILGAGSVLVVLLAFTQDVPHLIAQSFGLAAWPFAGCFILAAADVASCALRHRPTRMACRWLVAIAGGVALAQLLIK